MKNKKDSKKKQTWRKSVEKNGISKSVEVEEVENGFVVTVSESGENKGMWTHESKRYICKNNPLEMEDAVSEEMDAKKEMMEAIDAIND